MTSKQAIEELIKEREYAYAEKVNHKTETWYIDIKHYDNITDCINAIEKDLDRLAELEDKIESGLLVEQPCKVGDPVAKVYGLCNARFNMCPYNVGITSILITKEAAEAKLNELREE